MKSTIGPLVWALPGAIVALMALSVAVVSALRRSVRRKTLQLALLKDELRSEKTEHRHSREALEAKEQSLRAQAEAYQILMANSGEMVFSCTVTPDGLPGHFLEVNDVMCEKLGYSRDKLLTMTPLEIELAQGPSGVPGLSRIQMVTVSDAELSERQHSFAIRDAKSFVKNVLGQTQYVCERVLLTHTGTQIPVEMHAHRSDAMGDPVIMVCAKDLTEKQETERALRESEERFQDFFTHSPAGMAVYDARRDLQTVNDACLRMLGIPDRNEFAKFNPFDNPFLPEQAKRSLNSGETTQYEGAIDFAKVRDTSLFVSSHRDTRHLSILIQNLGLDREFNPKGYLVQMQDVTKRVQAEAALLQSERQLRQAQKMEAIGTLAGGIAHDFNNILTPIMGYTEMSLYTSQDNSQLQEYLQEVLKASNRAKELVNQILTFSRQTEAEGKPIRVGPITKEVLKLLGASLPPSIEIRRAIKTDQDIVMADPTQLHQVLMNLCTNAAHAMQEEGGVLEVLLTDFVLGPRSKSEFPQLEPGRYLRISVKDTGTGMDEATQERIFEPFYTTKESGEGTGMGLAVVHGIVTSLRGAITVDSAPGQGSVFHVVLPTIEQSTPDAAEAEVSLPGGNERVLFVDDEPGIARLVEHMLNTLNYQPVIVGNGMDALTMLRKDPECVDLVITDQVMPNLTGLDLARELRSLRPELPIILCTGFSEAFSRDEAESVGIREFMTKPITLRDLAEAMRRTLEGKDKLGGPST